jgi:leader peptidase (prepilin peptidase)/N-methyltransferase
MEEGLRWLSQPAVLPWIALVFGLCVGSFLNVVIYRLPRMMEAEWRAECAALQGQESPVTETFDLVTPRSRCPSCNTPIPGWHNVPLVSYVLLRGRCAACKTPISLKYPVVELLAGIGAAYAAMRFGPTPAAAGAALFVWFVIALSFIDQETGLLPDDLTLPLVWTGLILNVFNTFAPLREAVIGAAAGYLFLWLINAGFRAIRGMDGMGNGDFKLYAAVGAFLGWKMLFAVVFLSAFIGLIFGGAQMAAARRGWNSLFRFHFGPYIALAGLVMLFWGNAGMFAFLRPLG